MFLFTSTCALRIWLLSAFALSASRAAAHPSPCVVIPSKACTKPLCCCGQITMKFNHNGTHIEGLGLKHGEHRVIININAHDSLEGVRAAFHHVLAAWRHWRMAFCAWFLAAPQEAGCGICQSLGHCMHSRVSLCLHGTRRMDHMPPSPNTYCRECAVPGRAAAGDEGAVQPERPELQLQDDHKTGKSQSTLCVMQYSWMGSS